MLINASSFGVPLEFMSSDFFLTLVPLGWGLVVGSRAA